MSMLAWILLIVLFIAVFGLGTLLEVAFWVLLILAVIAVVAVVAGSRALSSR